MGLTGGLRARRRSLDRRPPHDRPRVAYLPAARHPWPCLVFLVPLLAAYELGVARLAPTSGESLRAGIELWLRQWLADTGPVPPVVIPGTLLLLLGLWTAWRWSDRPHRLIMTVLGLALEGVAFGIGLWILCLNAPAILDRIGLVPGAVGGLKPQVVTYVGVGIYEEVIFRLLGFAWLARVLRIALVPAIAAIPMAALVSAAAFALAHHFVQTDPFVPAVFLTRLLIGLYCATLFWLRGLGVAVGAHIVYDIVVGTAQG
jgi:Type II CAAX prenyl endopeptidase Rce1-like